MTATGTSHKYCVTCTGGPFKVTLVWADYPPSLAASVQLVNDLDLTVYADSLNGYGLLGNGVPDHLNNAEQVGCLPDVVASVLCSTMCCACCAGCGGGQAMHAALKTLLGSDMETTTCTALLTTQLLSLC